MSRNNKILLLILFGLITFSLLSALAPLSDFDQDGNLDSFLTEGLIYSPLIGTVIGLFFLWVRLSTTCPAVSQQNLTLIVPPPIYN